MTNALYLDFHWQTKESTQSEVRANALFIYSKLISAGVEVQTAKCAVEDLFSAGYSEGYESARFDSNGEGC